MAQKKIGNIGWSVCLIIGLFGTGCHSKHGPVDRKKNICPEQKELVCWGEMECDWNEDQRCFQCQCKASPPPPRETRRDVDDPQHPPGVPQ